VIAGIDGDRYRDRADVQGYRRIEERALVGHDLRTRVHAPCHVAETDVELLPDPVRSGAEIHRCFLQDIQVDPEIVLFRAPSVVAVLDIHVAGAELHAQVVVQQVQVAAGAEGVAAVLGVPAEAAEDRRRDVTVLVPRSEEVAAAECERPAYLRRAAGDGRDHEVVRPFFGEASERIALEIDVCELEAAVSNAIAHLGGGQVEIRLSGPREARVIKIFP
jgi:hypothetical protein